MHFNPYLYSIGAYSIIIMRYEINRISLTAFARGGVELRLIDFSDCKIDRHSDYGGSDRKNAIFYNGDRYMIKFSEKQEPKNDYGTSKVNNVISEYLGSHIFASIGIPVHETLLGTYNGELVVACKNFLSPGDTLHEFSWYLRNQYDSHDIQRTPVIEQVYKTISTDPDLMSIKSSAIERYWDTFVVDAIIGNFDRHSGNWGYIVDSYDHVRLAPVYDCGSCLYPALSSDAMSHVLETEYGIARRIFEFPKAALLVDGKKAGYYDMMSSGYNKDCDHAVLRIVPKIDVDDICRVVSDTIILSKERKDFYATMLKNRIEYIAERAFNRITQDDYDDVAAGRIGSESFKDRKEVIDEWKRAKAEMEKL